jgi:autotransporter-associated beta strand protein
LGRRRRNANLNTANNWGFNEAPKEYDTLLFAGNTRLAPNNNFTANTDFPAINFSNNASAFVLGGNTISLGQGITNDSATVQTINLNLDFAYATDHFTTNRYFNITAPNGSLVINGQITGVTNSYGRIYSVTKLGPGLLTLAGLNTFAANLNLNGGLVRFSTLDTNLLAVLVRSRDSTLMAVDCSGLPVTTRTSPRVPLHSSRAAQNSMSLRMISRLPMLSESAALEA